MIFVDADEMPSSNLAEMPQSILEKNLSYIVLATEIPISFHTMAFMLQFLEEKFLKYSLVLSRVIIAISGSSYGTFVAFEQARALMNIPKARVPFGQNMAEKAVASDDSCIFFGMVLRTKPTG